jgi:4-carboxymuconolactone decarboxylase
MSKPYRQGIEAITRIDPEFGPAFIEELKEVSPDFADYFVEFAFGKIYSRTALEPKCKELLAIASLTALGHGSSHLKLHIAGAIRTGCSREQITEVIIQSVIYVGFMRALEVLHLVKGVFDDMDANPTALPEAHGKNETQGKEVNGVMKAP